MCEYCHCFPHLPGCPNEEEQMSCAVCEGCGERLPVGAKIVDINGSIYCEDCVDDLNAWDVLEMFGVKSFEAEASEDDH